MLRHVWCWLRHPYSFTPLLWNGKREQWMHWCHRCGDWREAERGVLVEKMAQLTYVAQEAEGLRK